LTTYALNKPTPAANPAAAPGLGLTVLRYLDLIVLALALPFFLVLSLPLLGYAAIAAVWLIQRAVQHYANVKAEASDDPRTSVGVLAGSMLGRGWLTAGTILAVGLIGARADGLAAAVLAISLFTIYFAAQMVVRPFDEAARRPLPPKKDQS
jgi:hypothetical protein